MHFAALLAMITHLAFHSSAETLFTMLFCSQTPLNNAWYKTHSLVRKSYLVIIASNDFFFKIRNVHVVTSSIILAMFDSFRRSCIPFVSLDFQKVIYFAILLTSTITRSCDLFTLNNLYLQTICTLRSNFEDCFFVNSSSSTFQIVETNTAVLRSRSRTKSQPKVVTTQTQGQGMRILSGFNSVLCKDIQPMSSIDHQIEIDWSQFCWKLLWNYISQCQEKKLHVQ